VKAKDETVLKSVEINDANTSCLRNPLRLTAFTIMRWKCNFQHFSTCLSGKHDLMNTYTVEKEKQKQQNFYFL
jgi:hypothetical protein